MMKITPSGEACGATITGIDLAQPLNEQLISDIRVAWLEHHVLAFPDQDLTSDDLVRITCCFGTVGDDPYFLPIDGHPHVVAVGRKADEVAPVFAEVWHSDWSFKPDPPIGTCLYSLVIPPMGGDTGFVNQQRALANMPDDLRNRITGRTALHSAAGAYAPDGFYGDSEDESDRSMRIVTDESAREIHPHPLVVDHPESGIATIFSTAGYIIGIEGMEADEAKQLLGELYQWQTREEFQYTHKWQPNMFVMWDNRSVLHRANAGYDGYARELHRTTIAGAPGTYVA
ncbi:MAG: taurine dioxygenase [Limisphaerales bacterium]|jgi:taurine dioxygenase